MRSGQRTRFHSTRTGSDSGVMVMANGPGFDVADTGLQARDVISSLNAASLIRSHN